MSKRSSENRQKTHPVLVRMTEAEYRQLTRQSQREGTTRADFLRRCMTESPHLHTPGASNGHVRLSESDRILLAAATRSMGHLAGIMKLAVLKTPGLGHPDSVRSILEEHHRSLQDLQGQIRMLLECMK
jgi:hypothetical protein